MSTMKIFWSYTWFCIFLKMYVSHASQLCLSKEFPPHNTKFSQAVDERKKQWILLNIFAGYLFSLEKNDAVIEAAWRGSEEPQQWIQK